MTALQGAKLNRLLSYSVDITLLRALLVFPVAWSLLLSTDLTFGFNVCSTTDVRFAVREPGIKILSPVLFSRIHQFIA